VEACARQQEIMNTPNRMTEAEAERLKKGHKLIPHPDEWDNKKVFREANRNPRSIWFEFDSLSLTNNLGGRCCRVHAYGPSFGERGVEYIFYCHRFCSPPCRLPIDGVMDIWMPD